MNRQDHGWSSYAMSVTSEESFLAKYHATLGAWSKDEHGEYCPVHVTPRDEMATLPLIEGRP